MSHADFIRTNPRLGARMVVVTHEQNADVQNAWDVLVSAVGETEALLYLTEEFMERPAHNAGSSYDILMAHGIPLPQGRTVSILTTVRVDVDLADWVRDYGNDGHVQAFADAREHVPAIIVNAAREACDRLGWKLV